METEPLTGVVTQYDNVIYANRPSTCMLAIKTISQPCTPNADLTELMTVFTKMVNHCIKVGIREDVTNMIKLSDLCYHELENHDFVAEYKLAAISQAAGILKNRKQSIKRGKKAKRPVVKNLHVANRYGVKANGCLLTVPYKPRHPINILLNRNSEEILNDPDLTVRSFSMSERNLGICVPKEAKVIECAGTAGIDRNLRNVTCGNDESAAFYKTNKLLVAKENTIHTRAGFRRNDRRKKARFWKERQRRLTRRTQQYLHKISKHIVDDAAKTKSKIALENLKGIRKLYRKGNGQGKKYRRRLNGWPFYELQRQIEYKSQWAGIPVVLVDPKRASRQCPRCGKGIREDGRYGRKMLCTKCGLFMDRDIIAAMNIACKACTPSPRFRDGRGGTSEARVGTFEPAVSESGAPAIRIVDVSKSTIRCNR